MIGNMGYNTYYSYAYYGDGTRNSCYPEDLECIAEARERTTNTYIFIFSLIGSVFCLVTWISCCCCRAKKKCCWKEKITIKKKDTSDDSSSDKGIHD